MAQQTAHLAADLAVTLENDHPGAMAAAIGSVSAAHINIEGYAEIGGIVHVLTDNLRAAHDCLQRAGFHIIQEQQVVLVPVADEPGSAAQVFQRIAEAHINVRYSYLATRNRLVICTDKADALITLLTP